MKQKQIMISESLYCDLCLYALDHADPADQRYKRIQKEINRKLQAIQKRKLYTEYKQGSETARTEYLRAAGIPTAYQW